MANPIKGKKFTIQICCVRHKVTRSNEIKNSAVADPTKHATNKQINIHFRINNKLIFNFFSCMV